MEPEGSGERAGISPGPRLAAHQQQEVELRQVVDVVAQQRLEITVDAAAEPGCECHGALTSGHRNCADRSPPSGPRLRFQPTACGRCYPAPPRAASCALPTGLAWFAHSPP